MADQPSTPGVWTISIPKPSMAGGLIGGLEARGFWLAVGALLALWWTSRPLPNPTPTPTPTPGPVVPATEFFRLGQGYKSTILASYADALGRGADSIAAGGDVGKALAAIGADWTAARTKAFNDSIAPALERIAPGGTNPKPADLATAFRDLSRGVRP